MIVGLVLFAVSFVMAYQANAEGLLDPDPAMKAASIGYTIFDPALLATTILLYCITNQLYTYLVLAETYATGSPIDVGWMLGFGLIAWAAMKTRNLLN